MKTDINIIYTIKAIFTEQLTRTPSVWSARKIVFKLNTALQSVWYYLVLVSSLGETVCLCYAGVSISNVE